MSKTRARRGLLSIYKNRGGEGGPIALGLFEGGYVPTLPYGTGPRQGGVGARGILRRVSKAIRLSVADGKGDADFPRVVSVSRAQ
jgi:hypothetical protein